MATIDEVVRKYRAELAAKDAARMRELAQAFAQIARDLQPIIDEAAAALARATLAGESTLSAAYQRALFERLESDVLRRLQTVSTRLYEELQRDRLEAARRGERLAEELVTELLGAGGRFEARSSGIAQNALEAMLGALSADSPLARLLLSAAAGDQPIMFGSALAVDGAKAAADALLRAVALSLSPRAIAREVRDALGSTLTRALTIARTETARAQTSASIASYAAIPEVTGWVWISARDKRTCASCWAMHGRWFPPGTPMSEHPNGRCSAAPAIGQPDPDGYMRSEPYTAGPDDFAKLTPAEQIAILGPKKYAAYKAGEIALEDLVREVDSAEWGLTRSEASLTAARANAARKRLVGMSPGVAVPLVATPAPDFDALLGPGKVDTSDMPDFTGRSVTFGEKAKRAAEWAKSLGIDNFDVLDLAVRMDGEEFQTFMRTFTELARAVPGVIGGPLRSLGTTYPVLPGYAAPSWEHENANGAFWGVSRSIGIAPNGQRQPEIGWHLKTPQEPGWSKRDTLIHEFGHAFQYTMDFPIDFVDHGGGAGWGMKLAAELGAEYGSRNPDEAFAELFLAAWFDIPGSERVRLEIIRLLAERWKRDHP